MASLFLLVFFCFLYHTLTFSMSERERWSNGVGDDDDVWPFIIFIALKTFHHSLTHTHTQTPTDRQRTVKQDEMCFACHSVTNRIFSFRPPSTPKLHNQLASK